MQRPEYRECATARWMSSAIVALNEVQSRIDRPAYVPDIHLQWLLPDIQTVEAKIADIRKRMEARYEKP